MSAPKFQPVPCAVSEERATVNGETFTAYRVHRTEKPQGTLCMVFEENTGHAEEWANLFAAAPELLEALSELVAECDEKYGLRETYSCKMAMARNAIAKATGGES